MTDERVDNEAMVERFKDVAITYPFKFYPLLIEVTPGIEAVLKTDRAKEAMDEVTRACRKLMVVLEGVAPEEGFRLFNPPSKDDHPTNTWRHKMLHRAFDELFACFITQHPDKVSFLSTSLGDFMEWSSDMTEKATCEEKDGDGKYSDARGDGEPALGDATVPVEEDGRPDGD